MVEMEGDLVASRVLQVRGFCFMRSDRDRQTKNNEHSSLRLVLCVCVYIFRRGGEREMGGGGRKQI